MSVQAHFSLADTHCHLDFNAFDNDREEVLLLAREAGVVRLLNPGIDLVSSRKAVELAQNDSEVYAAVGVHPNEATTWDARTLAGLESLLENHKVVAIGEIGLDYYRNRAPKALQQQVFEQQLELAARHGLPVVIHNRQATEDLLKTLESWISTLRLSQPGLVKHPGVLHSYSGNLEQAFQAIELSFFLGITGPVTFSNAADLQRIVTDLPLDCLLVETDAPFLTPHPWRGKRNQPAYVRRVAEEIARLHQQPLEVVARKTSMNAQRLFNWRIEG